MSTVERIIEDLMFDLLTQPDVNDSELNQFEVISQLRESLKN